MISITLNGTLTKFNPNTPLKTAVIEIDPPFAVALNKKFIPQSQYENVILKNGDIVETVTPMQGG